MAACWKVPLDLEELSPGCVRVLYWRVEISQIMEMIPPCFSPGLLIYVYNLIRKYPHRKTHTVMLEQISVHSEFPRSLHVE